MKALARQLFKTFIFSSIISIAATSIYYAVMQKGQSGDFTTALPKMVQGIALLNIIAFIMALPSLFLINANFWNNMPVRLMLYFAGPLTFIITSFTLHLPLEEQVIYLIVGLSFIIVHTVYYFRRINGKV